jgi:hypothetical protein
VALLSVAEALERVLAHAAPLPSEHAVLSEAYGRVLTDDLRALRTQPPATSWTLEPVVRKRALQMIIEAEQFEHFLHSRFRGTHAQCIREYLSRGTASMAALYFSRGTASEL